MSLKQRLLFAALASACSLTAATAMAQSEPYYIPNTTPYRPNTISSPGPGDEPVQTTPSYAMPPAVNTGRPASDDITERRSASGSMMPSEMPPIYGYTQAGTQGLGVGAGLRLNPSWVIRAEVNGLNYNRDFSKGSNSYAGKAKLRSEGVYGDFYPMDDSGLRVTGGLIFNQAKLTGTAKLAGNNVVYNGNRYAIAAGETITAQVKSPSVLPYLGLGYENNKDNKPGLKFHADLGIGLGKKPEATITLPSSLSANTAANSDRLAEERKLEDEFDKFAPWVGKAQPIANIGIGYTW